MGYYLPESERSKSQESKLQSSKITVIGKGLNIYLDLPTFITNRNITDAADLAVSLR
jgi:hypothetical protein